MTTATSEDAGAAAEAAGHPFRSLFVSVADACAIDCAFCFRADRGRDLLSLDTYARALSRLKELSISQLCLTGGEPTDHPRFREFVRVALQFGWACSVVSAARAGRRQERLLSAASMLTHITLSADSRGAAEVGRTEARSVSSAAEVLRSLPPGRTTLNLVAWKLEESELRELAEILRTTSVGLAVTPLLPSLDSAFTPAAGRTELAAQWAEDLAALERTFDVSGALRTNFEDYIDFSNIGSSCRARTLYLSASGELRRCPYGTGTGIDVWQSRGDISRGVDALHRQPPTTRVECAQICTC